MLEILAQLMKDMLHPQPTAVRQAQGGTQKGRIHGHVKLSASSIMQFPCSVVIVSQLADQQPADFFMYRSEHGAKPITLDDGDRDRAASCEIFRRAFSVRCFRQHGGDA